MAQSPFHKHERPARRVRLACALGALLLLACVGCKTAELVPSNDRDWSPDQAILPYAKFRRDEVAIQNIRNCKYLPDGDYVLDYYDKTFDLNRVQSVDYIVVPFGDSPLLAHTMLSFGFAGDEYLGVSVEIRKEKGETYNPLYGAMHQYELMYVVADERDVIKLRTDIWKDNVYVYRVRATPEESRALLVDMLKRANKLRKDPEFYDTIANNCTNNIVAHVNKLKPGAIPYSYELIASGLSDQLAFQAGLLDTRLTFEETKKNALINPLAEQYAASADFSARIRQQTLASRASATTLR